MSGAIPLREDFDVAVLRALAKSSRDADQTLRLLCLVLIYEVASHSEPATHCGVTLQAIRD